MIDRFDKPGTLFYVDPPSWGNEKDYGEECVSRDNFALQAAILGAVKGKFVVSLNDTPGVRETFAGFRVEAVKTRHSISAKGNQAVGEGLIYNFPTGK